MQRIAFLAGLAALAAVVGCQQPGRTGGLGPPPGPILGTRTPERVEPVPWPERPQVRPAPEGPAVGGTVRLADIQVPGGISKRRWGTIVVHHAASDRATPQGMHEYHRDVRKWAGGLGYHFVIGNGVGYPDGKLYVGPRWKRQMTGAHCATGPGRFLGAQRPDNYFNEHGIGICLIGDFDHGRPTAKQLQTLQDLICLLVREADIDPRRIHGHGEVTHKTACPGRNMNMDSLRTRVLAAVNRDSAVHAGSR